MIHYSLIIMSLDTIQSEKLAASLSKSQISKQTLY
jgi:hypothetical protein